MIHLRASHNISIVYLRIIDTQSILACNFIAIIYPVHFNDDVVILVIHLQPNLIIIYLN